MENKRWYPGVEIIDPEKDENSEMVCSHCGKRKNVLYPGKRGVQSCGDCLAKRPNINAPWGKRG